MFGLWRKMARAHNFREYDAPVLEPLELYVEKSGEEIVEQLFAFDDRGGRPVALRPEMTPSLARLVAGRANSLKRPVKWFNIGEQYRYERPQKGRLRAFYQFNADILGEAGPAADAELIGLLAHSLRAFGLGASDFRIRLSDRDLWLLILEAEGVGAGDAGAVLGIIDKWERMERAKLVEKLGAFLGARTEAFLKRIEEGVAVGDPASLRRFIEGLDLDGEAAERARARLADWEDLLDRLDCSGLGDFVRIDLGIVRGLAYYTGFVFEAFEASGAGRALAGGGRYDGLVEKLGGPPMPAAGFAMGDVTLLDLLEERGLSPPYVEAPQFAVIPAGPEERRQAMGDAAALRQLGYAVEFPLKERSFGKAFKEAGKSGARFALIYGAEECARGTVKLRDLTSGGEKTFARAGLEAVAGRVLAEGLDWEGSEG